MMDVEQSTSSRGFVYVAWGEQYIQEAIESAKSLKLYMNYPVALITCGTLIDSHPFDQIIQADFTLTYRDKINMSKSPFEKTIFLDTDTTVLSSLDQIFELLVRFDVVYQPSAPSNHYDIPGMPMLAFYEPNAGIIGWRKNSRTDHFFDVWNHEYTVQEQSNGNGAWDQRSMRAALWKTDVQISSLGSDWQLMSFEAAILMNTVKMVHGRGRDGIAAIKVCNIDFGPRVFLPRLGVTRVGHVRPLDYAKLSILSAWMATRRSIRLVLHWSHMKPLPTDKRPA